MPPAAPGVTPRSWLFTAERAFLSTALDPFAEGLGGTEQAVIHLASALAARGHEVRVAASAQARHWAGVAWLPPGSAPRADVTVAINSATLLPRTPGLPVVWFHNEVEFGRELRKRRLPALLRHRPAAVFIGKEQARLASPLLPFRASRVIPYGLPPRVLAAEAAPAPPPPRAIFTSQAYRGLREVIELWRAHVAPACAGAHLAAYIGANDVADYARVAEGEPSISIHPRVGNDAVLDLLRGARVLLAPGHRSETFCLAAAEAIAMGVPVVTLGIGSLKERVADGRTGFIARNWREMARRTVALLSDEALWRAQHAAGRATRSGQTWEAAASAWENFTDAQIRRLAA